MLRTLKYLSLHLNNIVYILIPIAVALTILAILASIILWSDFRELPLALASYEVSFAVKLSLITALTSTTAAILLGIPVAYTLSRLEFKGKRIVETILMLPFAMPPIALGATLLLFFTNTVLGKIVNSILNVVFEVPGLIVAQFTVIFPMVIKVLKSSFDMVDERYEAVARTLGYTRFMTLIKVLLPMCKTGLVSSFILGFTRALGGFGASVTLAGATRFKTETLPIAIYLSLSSGDIPLTVALIIILLVVAFTTLLSLHVVRGGKVRII